MISREQFLKLAGALYDAIDSGGSSSGGQSGGGSGGGGGGAPKFDTSIARKGGMVQYASETDLDGLIFWKARAEEPPTDPKYAESNAKQAKALGYWIAYRRANPDAIWVGQRSNQEVTAEPPSNRPATYTRQPYSGGSTSSAAPSSSSDPYDETDDIPF